MGSFKKEGTFLTRGTFNNENLSGVTGQQVGE